MNDKTLGAYKRTTPDPDETTGEALARLQVELTRLLDEADAELRDEADGGVAAALIEKEAADTLSLVQHQRDQAIGRVNVLSDENDDLRSRAEKAERERDEARAAFEDLRELYGTAVREKDEWEANAEKAEARADAAESRPLTPDAIVELVKTSETRLADAIRALYPDVAMSTYQIASAVFAALTEPPARPEGAEEIEAILSELPDTMLPATDAGRADLLASRGVRAPEDGAA